MDPRTILTESALILSKEILCPLLKIKKIAHEKAIIMKNRQALFKNQGYSHAFPLDFSLDEGGVFCSMHKGLHLSLPFSLARSAKSKMIGIVVDSENVTLTVPFTKIASEAGISNIEIFNAQTLTGCVSILQFLRSGNPIFIYCDGNNGLQSDTGFLSARMFDTPIKMKSGFIFLAGHAGVPINFILAPEEYSHNSLKIKAKFTIMPDEVPRDFWKRCSASILILMEQQIINDPCLWEEWHQFMFWIDFKKLLEERDELRYFDTFSNNEYYKFSIHGQSILYDRKNEVVYLKAMV